MKETVLTVRIDKKLKKELEALEKTKLSTTSDVVREALFEYLRKEKELNEIRKVIAKRFAEGRISFENVVKLLGYEEAKKVAFFVETAKKSLEEGLA